MFRSLAAFVAVSDAARVEHHLNTETNSTGGPDMGGLIKVGDGTKCLAVYGSNYQANGVTIFAETCKPGSAHQTWKHENKALKNVAAPGKCLDIFENKCSNGQNLILWECNGQSNQQFWRSGQTIRSTKCGKCLDVDMASNIRNVLTWDCGPNKLNQKMNWAAEFSLAENEETEEGWTGGTIQGYKNLCVDAYSPAGMSEGIRREGTNIVTWPCHGGDNQQWKYQDGQIINTGSGMCLDIFENKCRKDQNLILWKCNGQKNQLWNIEANGQITSKKCSNYCVDIDLKSNTKHNDLYNLLLWSCKKTSDNVNQKWQLGGR